jgi:putative colanic acid biosynthesis UDP-glucose lipid carrier transferase
VALALSPAHEAMLPALIRTLRHFPVEVGLIPQLPSAELPMIGIKQIGNVPSVLLLEKPLDGWRYIIKAMEDRLLAAVILVIIAPLMLCIAAAVRRTSPGPILFRQKRLGFNQQMVEVFKFRTMYVDACDTSLSEKVVQATRDDPRVTPVGRFLRRTSLDELPQFLNVLRGEMSLVGPRPHAVAHDRHYAELIDGYLGRHRVKPGITGWAQVNGFRGETKTLDDMRRRIELDLFYIDHWSLLFDFRIILRTLFVGFAHTKAY